MDIKHQLLLPQEVKIGIGLIRQRLPNTLSDKIALTMSRAHSHTIVLKCEDKVEGVAVYILHQA
jgi:hypothetical protein